MKRIYVFFVFLIFVSAACSRGDSGLGSVTSVNLSMKIPVAEKISTAEKPVSTGVLSVRVRAEKGGGAGPLVSKTENVEPGQILEMKLDVEPGQGHVFIVEAFSQKDGSGVILYRGIEIADIVAESNPSITINMQAVVAENLSFALRQQITPPGTGSSTTRSRSSGQRNIAHFQGNAYSVWEQNSDIYFSETVLNSGVLEWSIPVVLDETSNRNARASAGIAIGPAGNLYVAYVDCTNCSGLSTIVLLMRKAGETRFVRLPFGDSAGFTEFSSNNPTLAVSPDGATVFVAWSAQPGDGENDILLQRVNPLDGIKIDEDPRPIVSTAVNDEQPTMGLAKDGKVFIAWIERDFGSSSPAPNAVMAMVSLNGGDAFEMPVQVNESTGSFLFDRRPTLVPGPSGVVYIAWEKDMCPVSCDGSIYQVAFDKGVLEAGVLTFGTDQSIGSFFNLTSFVQNNPSIAWDGANGIYIALEERAFDPQLRVNKRGIFMAKSSDQGQKFDMQVPVDDDTDDLQKIKVKEYPSVAVDETGRVFVVWTDERGGVSPRYIWFAISELEIP